MIPFRTGKIPATITGLFIASAAFAQQAAAPAEERTILSNGVFLVMLSTAILLLFVIIAMAEVVKAGAALQVKKKKEGNGNGTKAAITLFFILAAGSALYAQQAPAAAPATGVPSEPFTYWRLGGPTFYLMLSIIILELIIIFMLYRSGMNLLDRAELRVKRAAEKAARNEPSLMEKLNASVSIEEESAILMDHNYDGIQELDNNLPPWWKYGFYVTIVFAVIYLFHFHVLHSGKSSLEEYQAQIKEGEEQVAQYRKTAANLVDETNVTVLTDAVSISSGQAIFKQNCVACHGELGEGKIGPNFTDDYWIHGGSINDVFKSIKYGWTDKGMREWGSELKPIEIQQVASYIKSLRGTNPPNAKEKQGELYLEDGAKPATDSAATRDSLNTKADSVKGVKADTQKK
jgi:cytochrome c oxidase cbb3-type subunit 3